MKVPCNDLILEPRGNYSHEPNSRIFYDLIIIGAGIVGFSAAMYASRLGLKTLIIGSSFGGTIVKTDIVENWPGIVSVSGVRLAKLVEAHAKDYEIDILRSKVENVEVKRKGKGRHFKIKTNKNIFSGKTLILATGTDIRKLNIPGEQAYSGRGVSYCGLCDGPFFKDKTIGIIGGSDSAIKETLLLTKYVKKIYIIKGKEVRPEPINMKRLKEKIKRNQVEIINNTNVKEIKGDKKTMNSVILDKPYKNKKELALQGLFVYMGHVPLSKLAKDVRVRLNQRGEIKINRNSETNIKGVYAAGDVVDTEFKQAITGSAEGIVAAYHAYEYVNKGEFVLPCDECE